MLYLNNKLIIANKDMSKHTLNGCRKKVIKTSGYRARIKTKSGLKIFKNRRAKGRWKLAI